MAKNKNTPETGKTNASAPPAPADSGLPLFFSKPQPITVERHATASFVDAGYAFTQHANAIPIEITEFAEAMRCYPIVFTPGDLPMPMAVVGAEDANYAVGADGAWAEGAYIPTYVRQYPFVFNERSSGDCVLCIDEGAEHFVADGGRGSRFFDGEEVTDATKHALAFCGEFYRNTVTTRAMMADIKKHNLLMPREMTMTLRDEHRMVLSGFQTIDEDAFNALDEKVFAEFRTKGWLPFIYLSLASMVNWRRMLDAAFARRQRAAAVAA